MDDLTRVSEIIKESKQPAAYYRNFVKAAQGRMFQGVVMLADVVKLPPARKGGKVREVPDFAVLNSTQFQDWHTSEVARQKVRGVTAPNAPKFADLKAGKVSIEEAEQQTMKALDQKAERNARNAARVKKLRKAAPTENGEE